MKKNLKGKILNIETIAKDTVKLQFSTEISSIQPGQFVSVLIPNKTLRRPFSVSDFKEYKLYEIKNEKISDTKNFPKGVITIIFKLKGDGTNYLKSLKTGDEIDYLAPLGNGFSLPQTVDEASGKAPSKALLIGAGIGIAPMLYLKKVLDKNSISNFLISGFKTEDEVVEGSDETVIGGSVLDNIQDLIDNFKPDIIYSCGPKIVLELVCGIAEKNGLIAQVAMEKVMACGIGVCRGCVIRLKDSDGAVKNASVCADGPVFNGSEVIWE